MSGEQLEDRIVEVRWDPDMEEWRMMRFRDDKPAGNHINTVGSVIESIRDGVEKDAVRITQHLHGVRFLTSSSPSSSKAAGPSGPPGKLDSANQTNHPLLPTSSRDHKASPPLSPNRIPHHLLTLNLHTRTPIPTYKHGIRNCTNSSIPSRTRKRACKVVPFRPSSRSMLHLHCRTERLDMDRSKHQSGVR